MTTKKRRQFTPEFKREAVGLLASSGRTIRELDDCGHSCAVTERNPCTNRENVCKICTYILCLVHCNIRANH